MGANNSTDRTTEGLKFGATVIDWRICPASGKALLKEGGRKGIYPNPTKFESLESVLYLTILGLPLACETDGQMISCVW